jgi:hypothetical protein
MSEPGLTLGGTTADRVGSMDLLDSNRILIADAIDTLSLPNKAPVSMTLTATLVSHDVQTHCQGSRSAVATLLAPGITQISA